MSQIGSNVYPNTTFPDSVQTLPTFTDLTATDQNNYIAYLKEMLAGNKETARQYLNLITNTAIITANKLNTLSDTIAAIQDVFGSVDTFEAIINAKQVEWQESIDTFKYIGVYREPIPYSTTGTYQQGDVVLYQNKCWRCKVNGTTSANPPSVNNKTYWEPWYRKNNMVMYSQTLCIVVNDINDITDIPIERGYCKPLTRIGEKGNVGNGFNFFEEWDLSVSYSMGSLVVYDNKAYHSLINANQNNNPSTSNVWEEIFDFNPILIPVQSSAPSYPSNGDIWFKVIN